MHLASRMAASRMGAEAALAHGIEDGLGQNAAGGIPGAEKQDIEGAVGHCMGSHVG
jgi:hypothetical protein